ncbi:GAF domain-containing protein [Zavarzinella formosa]|uniref:GAF domain-containing protein n=1 Tax=Zavarzinella formosa TaxID=360055 RepID=UPI00037C2F77|nr:GAF domain-containing protein [Zavarzinella formosa]
MNHLVVLGEVLERDGPRAALAFLNARTGHRFTSMYRFDGKTLHNLTFYDRADSEAEPPDDIPVEVSYCVYVRDAVKPFCVEDSLGDIRVAGHPKRPEIRAYCGVPLVDENGMIFGTICHFDFQPTPTAEEDVRLMEGFALLLKRHELLR